MIREGWTQKFHEGDEAAVYQPDSGKHWVGLWNFDGRWYVYDGSRCACNDWWQEHHPERFYGPYKTSEDAFRIAEALNLLDN